MKEMTMSDERIAAAVRAAVTGQVDRDAPLVEVPAARRDVSSRGKVHEEWYRLVLEPGTQAWRYFASTRPPRGWTSAERHWTGYGAVPLGSLLAQHDRGGPIDRVLLVVGGEPAAVDVEWVRTASGLRVTLPGGEVLAVPDPRR